MDRQERNLPSTVDALTTAAATLAPTDPQKFEEGSFHRWYNFVLGFSDQLVGEMINQLGVGPGAVILDGFCGNGTTLVECAKRNIASIGIDANPFAIFAAKAKTKFHLNSDDVANAALGVQKRYREIAASNRRLKDNTTYQYLAESGMIDRGWISAKPLRKALALREAIVRCSNPELADVMLLALLADLPSNIGNMRFGPQIHVGPIKEDVDVLQLFKVRVAAIREDLDSLPSRPTKTPIVVQGDARSITPSFRASTGHKIPPIDFVICSPPYPTEHDYTRHTRLELAFANLVENKSCVRKIKRSMVRSHTKGIYRDDADLLRAQSVTGVQELAAIVEKAIEGKTSGFEKLYPTVVRSYFGGMKRHFGSLYRIMRSGGMAAYVVGDQAAYMRVPIRTAVLLGQTAETVGFRVREIKLWRRRWSTGISDYLDENILILEKP